MEQFINSHTNQAEALASIAESLSAISTSMAILAGCALIVSVVYLIGRMSPQNN